MKTWKLIFLIFIFYSCNSEIKKATQKEHIQEVEQVQEINQDGISLYDGKSLNGWEITNFGTQGPVYISEGNIILSYGEGCTGINFINDFPKVNYEVSLEAMKTSGNDFFCGITFPVNETFCSFIVGGWGGPVVGLSIIDGKDASENETKMLKNFEQNIWYKIKLKVTTEKIESWIDNEKILDFEIGDHDLYIRPEVSLSKPFGITTWNTTGVLRKIRLNKL